MKQTAEINQGEILIKFDKPTSGKLSFKDLGLTQETIELSGGFLRMVFDFEGIGEHDYFKVPTIEVSYQEFKIC